MRDTVATAESAVALLSAPSEGHCYLSALQGSYDSRLSAILTRSLLTQHDERTNEQQYAEGLAASPVGLQPCSQPFTNSRIARPAASKLMRCAGVLESAKLQQSNLQLRRQNQGWQQLQMQR